MSNTDVQQAIDSVCFSWYVGNLDNDRFRQALAEGTQAVRQYAPALAEEPLPEPAWHEEVCTH